MIKEEFPENKCTKCGECCHITIWRRGKMYRSDSTCPFLDDDSKLCLVYDHREKAMPGCTSTQEGKQRRVLPRSCAYVVDDSDYKPMWEDGIKEN